MKKYAKVSSGGPLQTHSRCCVLLADGSRIFLERSTRPFILDTEHERKTHVSILYRWGSLETHAKINSLATFLLRALGGALGAKRKRRDGVPNFFASGRFPRWRGTRFIMDFQTRSTLRPKPLREALSNTTRWKDSRGILRVLHKVKGLSFYDRELTRRAWTRGSSEPLVHRPNRRLETRPLILEHEKRNANRYRKRWGPLREALHIQGLIMSPPSRILEHFRS